MKEEDRAHLSRCKECADYVRGDESVRRLLAGLRTPDPGRGFEDRLIMGIHRAAERESRPAGIVTWNPRWAYAAAAVILAALGWMGWGGRRADVSPATMPATVSVDAEPERSPPQPSEPVTFPIELFRLPEVFVFQPPRPTPPPVNGGRTPSGAQMVLHDE